MKGLLGPLIGAGASMILGGAKEKKARKALKAGQTESLRRLDQAGTEASALTERASSYLDPSRVLSGGFEGGGLSGQYIGDTFKLLATPERTAGIVSLQDALRSGAGQVAGLREQVKPGFGALTQSIRDSFAATRSRTIGSLRDQLARRRMLGSSFGADAISRAEVELGQQEGSALATAKLQELDADFQMLQQENQLRVTASEVAFNDMVAQGNLAAELGSQAKGIMANLASMQAQLFSQLAAQKVGIAGAASNVLTGTATQLAQGYQHQAEGIGKAIGAVTGGMDFGETGKAIGAGGAGGGGGGV